MFGNQACSVHFLCLFTRPFVQDNHVVTAKVGQDGRRGVKRPHECLDKENVC